MFEYLYGKCAATLDVMKPDLMAFHQNPHRRPNGQRYYPGAEEILAGTTFHPTPETAVVRSALQCILFRVDESRPLADHLAELKRLGLRPSLYAEAVYVDKGSFHEHGLYEALLVLGETAQTVTRSAILPRRFPMITKKEPGIELVSCEVIRREVPVGVTILAIREVTVSSSRPPPPMRF